MPLTEEGSPTASIDRFRVNDDANIAGDNAPVTVDDFPEETHEQTTDALEGADAEEDDGFGDFDEFEEGGEGIDDFGDFDDGFQQGEEQAETTFDSPQIQTPISAPPPAPLGPVSATALVQAGQPFLF